MSRNVVLVTRQPSAENSLTDACVSVNNENIKNVRQNEACETSRMFRISVVPNLYQSAW
jgi:hypothetical protein